MQTAPRQPADYSDRDNPAEQVERCFRQLPISLAVNLANGLLLTAVLWGATPAPVLLSWLLLLIAVTGVRFLTLRAFRKAARVAKLDHVTWANYFVAGAGAAGLVWGASGVLLFHPSSFPHQVVLAFVLGGMVAGAVPLLSSLDHAYAYFAIPVVVPISLRLMFVGDSIHLIMGLMIAVFGAAMLASSVRVHALYRDSETLRRRLVSSLESSQVLELMARRDSLTEIPNRRLFEEELHKEWGRAQRDHETLAVVIADIDYFKEYNDRHGHPAGDQCLMAVAQTMQRALSRPGDVVARIGGEEFAFLLPRTTLSGALSVAEQIRERILALSLPHEASPVADQITVSFGVASSEDAVICSPAELIRAADMALYDAKHHGRNRIATSVRQG